MLVCCFVHLSLSCEVLAAFAACVVFFPFSLLCFFRRSLVFLFLLCCSGWISSINDGLTVCPCNLTMLGAAVPLHVLEILYPCLRPLCPCAPKSFELRTPTNFMNTGHQEFYEPVGPKVLWTPGPRIFEPKGPRTFSAALESLWTQNTRSFVNLRPQNIYEPETPVFLLKHKTPRNWWAWPQDTKTIPQA